MEAVAAYDGKYKRDREQAAIQAPAWMPGCVLQKLSPVETLRPPFIWSTISRQILICCCGRGAGAELLINSANN